MGKLRQWAQREVAVCATIATNHRDQVEATAATPRPSGKIPGILREQSGQVPSAFQFENRFRDEARLVSLTTTAIVEAVQPEQPTGELYSSTPIRR